MTPLDAYLNMRKTGSFWSRVGKGARETVTPEGVGRLGVQMGMVAGGIGAARAGEKTYYAITKKHDFNRMMETNPHLAEYQQEDPKRFNQHYSSFRTMNPQFASEPTVAGTYMHQMGLSPTHAGKVIVESMGNVPPSQGLQEFRTGMQTVERAGEEPGEGERSLREQQKLKLERAKGKREEELQPIRKAHLKAQTGSFERQGRPKP